jgi:hypothetical protein
MDKLPISLIVQKGALVPATEHDSERLRKQDLRIGQTVFAEIDTERHPKDLKRIHRLGQIVCENIDQFAHLDAHQAIKKLQAESGVGCDFMQVSVTSLRKIVSMKDIPVIDIPDDTMVTVTSPKSLSPAKMDGSEFHIVFDGLCRYLALHYWPEISAEDALEMVDLFAFSTP